MVEQEGALNQRDKQKTCAEVVCYQRSFAEGLQ